MTFTRISALILAAGLLFAGCASPAQPAVPEQETVRPQEIPAADPYEAFLAEKAYLTGEELAYGDPTGYCRLDLDGDGRDELLLRSGDGYEFGNFWVYTAPEGTVTPVPVEGETTSQFFGALRYSRTENALVYTEYRPMPTAAGYGFRQMKNGEMTVILSVGTDEVCGGVTENYRAENGQKTTLTAEEKDAILSEPQLLEFTPIP